MPRFLLGIACVSSAAFVTRPCLAIPAARLVYVRGSGAESCPDEDELRRAVATRLGYDPFFPTASSTLIADVERAKGRFVAHIKLVGDDDVTRGARRLEHGGPSCADMIDTMALSISIAIDPESLTRAPRPDPVPAADSSADRAPPVSPGATTAREAAIEPVGGGPARARPKEDLAIPRSESISYRIEAGGGVLGAVGAAPATNVGVEAFARWRSGRISLAVEGRIDAPATRGAGSVSVRSRMTTGALVPCVHEGRFAVCGVAAFGVLDATSDAPNPRDASAFHVALGPRVTFEVPLHSRVAFRTHADLLFVPTGQTFEVAGRPVMDLSRVAGVVGLGVVVRVDP